MVRIDNVNILGTKYTVFVGKREEVPVESQYNGLCYTYDKIIYIVREEEEGIKTTFGKQALLEEIIYHEVSHAFLFESGFSTDCDEETLVIWLSRNVRKINNCVLDILDYLDAFDKEQSCMIEY